MKTINKFKLLIINVIFITTSLSQHRNATYLKNLWFKAKAQSEAYIRPTRSIDFENIINLNNCELVNGFDFIIVGGGTAGLVLANRLSEIPSWRILVLEAGGELTELAQYPGSTLLNYQSDMNWGYLTTPQTEACRAKIGNQCDFTQGKVLGGSSELSALVHVRGNRLDFSRWEDIGLKTWSYDQVLPYLIKSETIHFEGDIGYHGYSGPFNLNHPPENYLNNAIKGYGEMGYNTNIDYNGAHQTTATIFQMAMNNNKRVGTYASYLAPVRDRPNLQVITRALVIKLLLNEKTVEGVTYLHNDTCFTAVPNIEVLLTAGAINSAQILLLSGVGPEEELSRHNITQYLELPVGKNLIDHAVTDGIYISTNVTRELQTEDEVFEDLANGEGLLTNVVASYGSFIKTDYPFELDFPEVENAMGIPIYGDYIGLNISKKGWYYNDKYDSTFMNIKPNDIIMNFSLLRPKSFGTVTLRSSDPLDFPYIDPALLSHPDDIETLYRALIKTNELFQTDAMRAINASGFQILLEPCRNMTNEKDQLTCYIQALTQPLYNPTSTCRMGLSSEYSVVDENFLLHGLKNIRVMDASSIPIMTSGHVLSIVLAIAERGADIIKKTYL